MPTVILNSGAQLQAVLVTVLTTFCKLMQGFIKNVQLRMGARVPVSVLTDRRDGGGPGRRTPRDHGPLSALTFASLASTSAIRFCARRICQSSILRRVLSSAGVAAKSRW